MFKKLVANNQKTYYIDRTKISCIFDFQDKTTFIIDGFPVFIDIHHENALIWLNSTEEK